MEGRVNPSEGGVPAATPTRRARLDAVVLPFLMERGLLLFVVLGAIQLIPGWPNFTTPHTPLIDVWVRWDSFHYLDVVELGYGHAQDAFFPLYPTLIWMLGQVLPTPVAAVLISQVAALAAFLALYAWTRGEDGEDVARRGVWLLLIFPTSFFLGAAYAESLYLALSIGAFVSLRRGKLLDASVLVFLACLARPQGFLCLTIPFGVAWLVQDRSLRGFPYFALSAFPALAVLMLVHQTASGDPLGFLHGDTLSGLPAIREARYGVADSPPWWAILMDEGLGRNLPRRLLNWSAIALTFVGGAVLLRRRRIAEGLLCWLTVGLPLGFHGFFDAASMARYALLAFPLFPLLAEWTKGPLSTRAVNLAFPMMQVILFSLYATWHWAE